MDARGERARRKSIRLAALNADLTAEQRIRAIEILVEMFGGVDLSTARTLIQDRTPAVRARTAWALGRHFDSAEKLEIIAGLCDDKDPLVSRIALETMLVSPPGC